jgi:hypothetical protein
MSITYGYCTLEDLKARIGNISGTASDSMLESVVEAVSREIDNYCRRRFYSADESRYYTAEESDVLAIDDIGISLIGTAAAVTVETDEDGDRTYEIAWADTDFDLWPYNEAPYMELRVTPNGTYTFPAGMAKAVKVTAPFGYVYGTGASDAPEPVQQACLLQSYRIWKRKDAPFGVTGSAEMGQMIVIPKLDPDVAMLINPYRRLA